MAAKVAAPASIDDCIAARVWAARPILRRIRAVDARPPVCVNSALLQAVAPYRGENGKLSFPLADSVPCQLIRRGLAALAQAQALDEGHALGTHAAPTRHAMWLRAANPTRNARERELLLDRVHNTPRGGEQS